MNDNNHEFTVASLFCGAGGLDLGFRRAGFRTVWANDFDPDACATFKAWSPSTDVVCGDIGKVDAASVPDVDVMLGGFPCQGFSCAGPRKVSDPRNKLYNHYVRIVSTKRPLAFVGENVKGLLTMNDGEVFARIKLDFAGCGYDVFSELVDACDFGVPENRERVIIAGFRKDLQVRGLGRPPEAARVTLSEALSGFGRPDPSDVCVQPFSPRYMSRNRKRSWDEASFTIPAMAKQVPLWPGSPDMVKLGPDKWRFGDGPTRRLSWREAAAVQTFPIDYPFQGDLVSKYKQIGNAVPPTLAEAFARLVKHILCERYTK